MQPPPDNRTVAPSDRTHLLFINRYFWPDESATAQLLSDLAFGLAAEGFAVTVITGKTGYRDAEAVYPDEETRAGVRILRRGGARKGRVSLGRKVRDLLSFFLGTAPVIRRAAKDADWVVSLTDPPLLSNWVCLLAGGRSRHACWCMDVFPEIATLYARNFLVRWSGRVLKPLRDAAFRKHELLVALGEDMAAYLERQPLQPARVERVRTWGLERGEAQPGASTGSTEALRAELGIGEAFTVGYSGNLGRVHEPHTVAHAIGELPEDWPGTFLFFAGGRNLAFFEAAEARWPEGRVRIHPPRPRNELSVSLRVPDVHWLSVYPHFSDFVFPSKFAGILGAGKPCIFVGKEGCEIARLIREARCGYAVHAGDYRGFADAVECLRADPEKRRDMGQAARALYEAEFTPSRARERWRRLLADGGGGPL